MWDIVGQILFILIVSHLGFKCLRGLFTTFVAPVLGLNVNPKTMGQWAVVTGATDGIGKAYAFELAKRGLDLILISRNPAKLKRVANEISSQHNVRIRTIDVDFTSTDIYEKIRKETSNYEIGVLVNNVGMNYDGPDDFCNLEPKLIMDLINCNIVSYSMVTKIIMEGMVGRKKGLIINVSSLCSDFSSPLLTVYAATKAYISSFSKSLEIEGRANGIMVQCLKPGFVVTNMSLSQKASLSMPSAMSYVESAIKSIGIETCTAGYHYHKYQIFYMQLTQRFLPDFVLNFFIYSKLSYIKQKFKMAKLRMTNGKSIAKEACHTNDKISSNDQTSSNNSASIKGKTTSNGIIKSNGKNKSVDHCSQ